MSIEAQVETYIARAWGHVIDELRQWWESTIHHGCFCGPGGQRGEVVDELDGCCQVHDEEYGQAGISADTMWWPPDAYVAGRQADANLVACAQNAATDNDIYRDRLIWLFSRRIDIADAVVWYRARLEEFRDWLGSIRERVVAEGGLPPDLAADYEQYVAYLTAEGMESDDLVAAIDDAGLDPGTLQTPGSTEPTALA
jgi:hypothetical protein